MQTFIQDIINSEKLVLLKAQKYAVALPKNEEGIGPPIESLQSMCVRALDSKGKDFLYENRETFPNLFEEMLVPISNAKRIIHLSIILRELNKWVHIFRDMGFRG
jgi:hypothetical protein